MIAVLFAVSLAAQVETPDVSVFFDETWPADFRGSVEDELRALLGRRGLTMTSTGAGVIRLDATIIAFREEVVLSVQTEAQPIVRTADVGQLSQVERGLTVALLADELLRSNWVSQRLASETGFDLRSGTVTSSLTQSSTVQPPPPVVVVEPEPDDDDDDAWLVVTRVGIDGTRAASTGADVRRRSVWSTYFMSLIGVGASYLLPINEQERRLEGWRLHVTPQAGLRKAWDAASVESTLGIRGSLARWSGRSGAIEEGAWGPQLDALAQVAGEISVADSLALRLEVDASFALVGPQVRVTGALLEDTQGLRLGAGLGLVWLD